MSSLVLDVRLLGALPSSSSCISVGRLAFHAGRLTRNMVLHVHHRVETYHSINAPFAITERPEGA